MLQATICSNSREPCLALNILSLFPVLLCCTVVEENGNYSINYVWDPHRQSWRCVTVYGKGLGHCHEKSPIPPLTLRDESDSPITVRMNAAAVIA